MNNTPAILAEIVERIDALRQEIRAPERLAVSASAVARMLSVNRGTVYKLHHAGALNGFRPEPNSDLKFLVSEVRELARRMSEERVNA